MRIYTETERKKIYELWQTNQPVSRITELTEASRSTVYRTIKGYELKGNSESILRKYVAKLETKIRRLEQKLEIIKQVGCSPNAPLREKLVALETLYGKYSVHLLCETMEVSRGTFYNHILRNKRDNTWYAKQREILRVEIKRVYDDSNQVFGAGKITAVLKERAYNTCEETVRRLMKDMGLVSIRQRAKALYEQEKRRVPNNVLNQQFTVKRPNSVWVSDVTCYKFGNKIFYICAILDLYARKIVGCRAGLSNSTQLVKRTFKEAYENRKPEKLLLHTDRGSNYSSYTFNSYLKSIAVTHSFSRAYVPYDNSVMESFFSNMKREELYRRKYRSEREIHKAITDYVTFYNDKRPHISNGYKTPTAKEELYFKNLS